MTMTSTTQRVVHVGTGAVSEYPFAFRVDDETELRATQITAAGVVTVLELGVGYSLSGIGNVAGGTCVLLGGALALDAQLILERVPKFTQTTNLRNQAGFIAETHEAALDQLTQQTQRLAYLAGELSTPARFPRLADTDDDGDGAYDARQNRIANLGAPTEAADAVRLEDVEAILGGTLDAQQLAQGYAWQITATGTDTYTLSPAGPTTGASSYVVAIDGLLQVPGLNYSITADRTQIAFADVVPAGVIITIRNVAYARGLAIPEIVATYAARPEASAETRGKWVIIKETGQPDVLQICLAGHAGQYDWQTVAVGPV